MMQRQRVCSSILSVFFLCVVSPSIAQSNPIEYPRNGWEDNRLKDDEQTAKIAYPYSPIDRGAQKYRTMIVGKIAAAKNNPQYDRKPHTLVVNGNAMRLYADQTEGRYARPWAFGPGSNSIEIRADGKSQKRVQFYAANPNQRTAKLRVIGVWDDPKAEVDLHIITPDGQHATWSSPLLKQGGGFDVDSVDGAGPEIFSTVSPPRGHYYVYVNYWGNFSNEEGYNFDQKKNTRPLITTTITLLFNENTPNERRETVVVPLRRIGDLTLVKHFMY